MGLISKLTLITALCFSACAHNKRITAQADSVVVAPSTELIQITPEAQMSPQAGEAAFNRLYELIGNAKKYAYISVYSWSDTGLEKAIDKAMLNPGVQVKLVLDPSLKKSAKLTAVIPALEAKGVEFKLAPMNMHEKFTVIDDETLVNTSANFSNGAKTKYSENMIFHELQKENSESIKTLISDFKNEFTILWSVSKDIVTNGEANAANLSYFSKTENSPTQNTDMTFYSSSMNWTLKENAPSSSVYKAGKYKSLVRKYYADTKEQTWTVRDALIQAIKQAEKSIYLSLNHFNIRAVSDELIAAVKRGVDVKFAVDNQEYKLKPNGIEMTPQFVQDWKALKGDIIPPVRVKYYSHEPSARYWLLNHHKFILIDYEVPEKTTLLSGSYNLSKNAEQNQFDNVVVYKTNKYQSLYLSFFNEFQGLWNLNRIEDKPKQEILDLFLTIKDGTYPLHINQAVSLTWPEIIELRSQVSKKAPGIFSALSKKNSCIAYNFTQKLYVGCPK